MKIIIKMDRFFQLLLICSTISFISWFIILFTTPNNVPFLFGSIASLSAIFLVLEAMTGELIENKKEVITEDKKEVIIESEEE